MFIKNVDRRGVLSALWVVVLMNTIFRDIHQFISPGFIDEIRTGMFNGQPLRDEVFLFGAVMLQVPFGMIVLSHLLTEKWLRWLTRGAVLFFIPALFMAWPSDMDDWFHVTIQVGLLLWMGGIAGRPLGSVASRPAVAASGAPGHRHDPVTESR